MDHDLFHAGRRNLYQGSPGRGAVMSSVCGDVLLYLWLLPGEMGGGSGEAGGRVVSGLRTDYELSKRQRCINYHDMSTVPVYDM